VKNDFPPVSIDFYLISGSTPIVGIENADRIFYSINDIMGIRYGVERAPQK
jgi:hypothetical protein